MWRTKIQQSSAVTTLTTFHRSLMICPGSRISPSLELVIAEDMVERWAQTERGTNVTRGLIQIMYLTMGFFAAMIENTGVSAD